MGYLDCPRRGGGGEGILGTAEIKLTAVKNNIVELHTHRTMPIIFYGHGWQNVLQAGMTTLLWSCFAVVHYKVVQHPG